MVVVYVAIGIITLFLVSLLIPLDIIVDCRAEDATPATVTLRWLFGLVKFKLDEKKWRTDGRRIRKWGLARIKNMSIDFRALLSMIKFVKRLLPTLKVKRLTGYIKLGLSNPAYTAIAFALIQPLAAVLPILPGTDLKIEPAFSTAALEAHMEGRVRVFPIRTVITVFNFALSRDGWYLMRSIIRKRWR